jgi:hypothetical protein
MSLALFDEKGLEVFSSAHKAIAEMRDKFMGLKINGLDDKEGYKAVHEARMTVKGKRVEMKKKHEELKRPALDYGKKVDEAHRALLVLIDPIESHLGSEEEAFDKAKEELKRKEAEEKAKITQARVELLIQAGMVPDIAQVGQMDDKTFKFVLDGALASQEAKRVQEGIAAKEKAAAEAARKAEDDRARAAEEAKAEAYWIARIAREAEEQAKIEEALKAEEARLADERAALEKQKQEAFAAQQEAAKELARQQEEADRAAKENEVLWKQQQQDLLRQQTELEAKLKAEADRILAEEQAKAEEERKARALELRPEREKLLGIADTIRLVSVQAVKSKEAVKAAARIKEELERVARAIEAIVMEEMV